MAMHLLLNFINQTVHKLFVYFEPFCEQVCDDDVRNNGGHHKSDTLYNYKIE